MSDKELVKLQDPNSYVYQHNVEQIQKNIRDLKISPSNLIICIWPSEKDNQYNIRVLERISNKELQSRVLNQEEFDALKHTKLFKKSCTVSSNRCIPAKLLINECKVINNMLQVSDFSEKPYIAEIPRWVRERKQITTGISQFLGVMENMNNNPIASEEDMRKFLYWAKKYNINLNIRTDELQPELPDYVLDEYCSENKFHNMDSILLNKFLGTVPDKTHMKRMIAQQLQKCQQVHAIKSMCGFRPPTASVGFKDTMCVWLNFKPMPQAFGDLAFYLYEKWGLISQGITEDYVQPNV